MRIEAINCGTCENLLNGNTSSKLWIKRNIYMYIN